MPRVTYITTNGDEVVVDNAEGTLMTAAVANRVAGIDGDCGGVGSCATCHVHVDAEWTERVGPATDMEQDMLEFEDDTDETSRLGCQVKLTPELDGLVVRVAER
ncbi:MAG: 2Fe-2S iron-sulfur cluster-binding protein [Planctomycetota bacterium]